MDAPLYRLEDLAFSYPGSAFTLTVEALEVRPGEVLALVGPNGAGKSTLLGLLAFLLKPGAGRLEFRGRDPWADGHGALAARRDAVLVSHHPYLFKGTVADNVGFGLRLRKVPEPERSARVEAALALVELDGGGGRSVAGLSAGQAQRVALARALALRPRVLLFDEPTANLDAGLSLRTEALLREAGHSWGATVVFSTHNFSQASRLAGTVLYLSEGRRVEFSHENCFCGVAATDGRTNWIEPKPGVRIVCGGPVAGHATCVIDPADIRLIPAGDGGPAPAGPNVFRGRVTRMETTGAATALVRVSGDLVFRAVVPLAELGRLGVSLSGEVLLRFEPSSVALVPERTAETGKLP